MLVQIPSERPVHDRTEHVSRCGGRDEQPSVPTSVGYGSCERDFRHSREGRPGQKSVPNKEA